MQGRDTKPPQTTLLGLLRVQMPHQSAAFPWTILPKKLILEVLTSTTHTAVPKDSTNIVICDNKQ